MPTYPRKLAPEGLLTRRQLRARGLRPGGQDVVAQVGWRSRLSRGAPVFAYLYRLDLARPVRPMSEAKRAALDCANRARRLCPACGRDAGYVLPAAIGTCVPCADGWTPADYEPLDFAA
ncbi:hypothetical protein C7C46_12360 [Streptomyces tateyamensis]|uniref:Uncharacterized protein n=1 Tax=Streptomyces tateyamensis TaxID=565073 RepID=A0A2V4N810_9ACTN|nr:RRQRL motif-containing zinc-binding protein [Streptomyces tateyamensis]PYC80586.1 hypothetical protein C7C46_12360 [Streptomyces tateyamensis]